MTLNANSHVNQFARVCWVDIECEKWRILYKTEVQRHMGISMGRQLLPLTLCQIIERCMLHLRHSFPEADRFTQIGEESQSVWKRRSSPYGEPVQFMYHNQKTLDMRYSFWHVSGIMSNCDRSLWLQWPKDTYFAASRQIMGCYQTLKGQKKKFQATSPY